MTNGSFLIADGSVGRTLSTMSGGSSAQIPSRLGQLIQSSSRQQPSRCDEASVSVTQRTDTSKLRYHASAEICVDAKLLERKSVESLDLNGVFDQENDDDDEDFLENDSVSDSDDDNSDAEGIYDSVVSPLRQPFAEMCLQSRKSEDQDQIRKSKNLSRIRGSSVTILSHIMDGLRIEEPRYYSPRPWDHMVSQRDKTPHQEYGSSDSAPVNKRCSEDDHATKYSRIASRHNYERLTPKAAFSDPFSMCTSNVTLSVAGSSDALSPLACLDRRTTTRFVASRSTLSPIREVYPY